MLGPETKAKFPLLYLPDLVIREIFHYISGQDLKGLRLTCKVLNTYVTPRLFDTITLTPHETHFQHLLKVFCVHDGGRLAGYVRTLRFDCRFPAVLYGSCSLDKSYLHRYDAHVLKRRIGLTKYHLYHPFSEFCKFLDGLRFPQLRNLIICDDGIGTVSSHSRGQFASLGSLKNIDDVKPSFYLYRFPFLTSQPGIAEFRWVLKSDRQHSKFYVICLLVAVCATGRRISAISFESDDLGTIMKRAAMLEATNQSISTLDQTMGGQCVARDFISAPKYEGYLGVGN